MTNRSGNFQNGADAFHLNAPRTNARNTKVFFCEENRNMRHMLISFLSVTLAAVLVVFSVLPVNQPSYAAPGEESGARLKSLGIIQGNSTGDLMLDKNLNRVELAVLLSRLYGEEWKASTYTEPSAFKDEAKFPKWGVRYIAYAQHRGWLVGDSAANFNPYNNVSGEELAVLLLRILGYEEAKWGKNVAELEKRTGLVISSKSKALLRGELFDVLWMAVSKPVMKDGEALLDKIDSSNGTASNPMEKRMRDALASMVRIEGYDSVSGFFDGYAFVTRMKDGREEGGFIDTKGNLAVPFDEKYIHNAFMMQNRFSDGRSMFCVLGEESSRFGYIDAQGKIVIPAKYNGASTFKDGMAYVEEGNEWHYIDVNGTILFTGPSEYRGGGVGTRVSQMTLYYFKDGLAMIQDSLGRSGFIDKKGNVFIHPSDAFLRADFFEEDLATVVKRTQNHDEKWGFINKKGELVVDAIYDEACSFSEGLAAVRTGSFDCPSWGFIDKAGKVAIPLQYCYANSFEDGLAFVANGSFLERKGGYIDRTGKVVIPFEYNMGRPFEEGRAVVRKDDLYGYIDKTGKQITDFVFDDAASFEDGLAVVCKNGRYGIIGLDGAFLVEPIYDHIFRSPDDDVFVMKIGLVHWILTPDLDD